MDSKQCTKCGDMKVITEFHKDKSTPDGLKYHCKTCKNVQSKKHYAENKEYYKQKNADWYEENKDVFLARERDLNKNRDCARRWYHNNKARSHANTVAYKMRREQRTPSWANEQLISAYYMEAKRLEELTGIKFHVDHIIPLQGELVSGLHVETNLQVLTATDNLRKSNDYEV